MATANVPSRPDSPAPPLVGREREQAMLRAALAAALARRGSLVLIGGEAGIGKTALAEALLAGARTQGALILAGHCYDLAETPPYGPWAEALGRLTPAPDVLPALSGESAVTSQAAIYARVRDALAERGARQPLVVFLDDVHWADLGSLDLLRFLARTLAELPLLLLASYRSDELTRRHPLYQLLPALVREARATRLELRPLEQDGLRALVGARYGLAAGDEARLVAYLQDHAEGNPFYAGELLRALEETRTLGVAGDRWQLGDLAGARLPALLRQVIDGRLARLGEEAVRLLGVAAVIGQVVPHDLWATVGEADEAALLDAVERAVESRVLVETPAEGGYRFAHALIREALYEGLLLPRRRAWHRRIGEALATTAAPDPDAVAYHFQQAGDARAAEWLVRAGDRAVRAYAWDTAAARYEAALASLEGQGAALRDRAYLLHLLAQLRRYSDRPRAIALLAEAATLAEQGGDAVLAAAARFDRGHLLCLADRYDIGLPELRATFPLLEALPPDQFVALPATRALGVRPDEAYHRSVLFYALAWSGHLAEAATVGAESLAMAPGTSHRALLAVGALHQYRGEAALAARAFATAASAVHAAGQHRETLNTVLFRALLHQAFDADDLAARRLLAAEAQAILSAARSADATVSLTQPLLPLRFIEGDWEELARWAREYPWRHRWFYAPLARYRGDVDEAWARVRSILPVGPAAVPGTAYLSTALWVQRVAIGLSLDAGDLPAARAWLEAHDRWLAWSGAVLWRADGQLGWAAYHRASGDFPAAREHADRALAHALEPRQSLALLAAHRAIGELATLAGRYPDATAALDAALALAAACAAPYERALTLLAQAELYHVQGAGSAATAALAEARTLLAGLGARPALARADLIAARLAASAAPTVAPAYPAGLSAREAEVLRLVAQGLSNAQAAERLFLSPRTVDQHLRSIYGKLGVENRAAATRFAMEHGLA